jgi:hypothetical protein
MRVALTSLLVASGIGVVGVVPALAASKPPVPVAFESHHDLDHLDHLVRKHDRLFRDRRDVRYVWFRVCDATGTGAAAATTTTTVAPVPPTTEAVAPDAIAAAVEGAAAETATTTDTATATDAVPTGTTTTGTTTTEVTPTDVTPTGTTTATEDAPDAKVYPTFIVVPLPKSEAKAIRKLDERPCYDLTTGAPQVTDTTTPTTTTTTDTPTSDATPAVTDPTPAIETTTATPVGTVTG